MNTFRIEAQKKTPFIEIDPIQKSITMQGMSSSENSLNLYKKVIEFMDQCNENASPIIHAEINFKYFNTSSAKCILDILDRISQQQQNGHQVKITWYYEEDDIEMLEAIQNYSEIAEVNIQAVAVH